MASIHSNQPSPSRPAAALPLIVVLCGCAVAFLASGPRSAMGFFQIPMIEAHGWDRSTFGLAIAIQNLIWGMGQPFFGAISDKYGTWRVLALGGAVSAAGLVGMAYADTSLMLHATAGILLGLGIAAASFAIVMAAFARHVPPERRLMVFAFGTASASAAMAAFSPISVAMIGALGWQDTLVWWAGAMLLVPLLAIPLRGNAGAAKLSQAELDQTIGAALREAFAWRGYILLIAGFFVCGFHVAFITTHFPAYISDIGIEARYAGLALMLIGLFNIAGSLGSGIIGQRYSKPMFLTWIYLARAIAIAAFLLLPKSPASVLAFSVVMGLLWLSTVAPTNALVAVMFGTRYLGMLGGIVFFSHQIGSFLGVWLGGLLYDIYGSFDIVWWLGVALGLLAAVLHWPIEEKPVERPVLEPAE